MPLIEIKCKNCGASLQVDNSEDRFVCPHCKTAYIFESSPNNSQGIANNGDFEIQSTTLVKYNGSATDVVIPEGVTEIDEYAFYKCSNLKKITLPESVIEIGTKAFYECENLSSIRLPNKLNSIGMSVFGRCYNLTDVYIPYGITEIGECMFMMSAITNVTIPESATIIRDSAFYECKQLKSIEIPSSVKEIENDTFKGCDELEDITIHNGVRKIGGYAFAGCKMAKINIPASVTELGDGVFAGCHNLKQAIISGNIPEIGAGLFRNCANLEFTTIPSNVRKIGYNAFEGCKSLKTINGAERYNLENFTDTPWLKNTIQSWKTNNLCQHCGGKFKGLMKKTCSKCGKPKDY